MRTAPWMLVTYHVVSDDLGSDAKPRAGVLGNGEIRHGPPEITDLTLLDVLTHWAALAPVLRELDVDALEPVEGARLLAPLHHPPKVLCAGANFYAHLAEMGVPEPSGPVEPYFFFKPPTTSVIGDGDAIVLPLRPSRQIDWEVELAAVVGRRCTDVPVAEALDVGAGWTIVNDISARDLLGRVDPVAAPFGHDWVGAKAGDTFCPMGPGIVPSWLFGDPQDTALRLTVNGVVKQDSSTTDMVTPVAELISAASRAVTLEPGDVIATGTPAGVGFPRRDFLEPGDVVVAEIDGIGALRNPVTERREGEA